MNLYGTDYTKYDLACAALVLAVITGASFILTGVIFWAFVVLPGGY